MILRRFIVIALERACVPVHQITHRRPFLWTPWPLCPLAELSYRLEERWKTGAWRYVKGDQQS